MRLLVTRPQPDADGTAARLVALGHRPLVQPLLTISFNPPPADLPRPGAILATSQNAVRALARWPQAAGWRDIPVFAAGPATARAVAAIGFGDVRADSRDAGSLADVVLGSFNRDAGPLLYPAARDRAGALAGGLTAHGYDVRMVEAYRADPVTRLEPAIREALVTAAIDGILLYSARTAKTLVAVASAEGVAAALARPEYFVISEHVAGFVSSIGGRVHVSPRPDEDSLLALIPAAT